VVQELSQRDALRDRADIVVESQRSLADELQDDRGDEGLGHAPDPKAMVRRHRLSSREIRDAGRSRPGRARVGSHNDSAWYVFLKHRLEVIVE
jgi:hypothetical protein